MAFRFSVQMAPGDKDSWENPKTLARLWTAQDSLWLYADTQE
jgi:hypothetical protein